MGSPTKNFLFAGAPWNKPDPSKKDYATMEKDFEDKATRRNRKTATPQKGPADTTEAYFGELARMQTERRIRASQGRTRGLASGGA